MTTAPDYLETADNHRIAYHHTPGNPPGVIFLGGFMSDMTGAKALALEAWCQQQGVSFTRFDYSGHGQSSGRFETGTIGAWLNDALAIFDQITAGPQIVVGSSMGGWLSLLLTLKRPERVQGVLTIACATDFTERLLRPALKPQQIAELQRAGIIELPSHYSKTPYRISRRLLDEGLNHQLLQGAIAINCPVHMIHGSADKDVPPLISQLTLERLTADDTRLTLIEGGDHRLSSPEQLARITGALAGLIEKTGGDFGAPPASQTSGEEGSGCHPA